MRKGPVIASHETAWLHMFLGESGGINQVLGEAVFELCLFGLYENIQAHHHAMADNSPICLWTIFSLFSFCVKLTISLEYYFWNLVCVPGYFISSAITTTTTTIITVILTKTFIPFTTCRALISTPFNYHNSPKWLMCLTFTVCRWETLSKSRSLNANMSSFFSEKYFIRLLNFHAVLALSPDELTSKEIALLSTSHID